MTLTSRQDLHGPSRLTWLEHENERLRAALENIAALGEPKASFLAREALIRNEK
jgi:hypothetical protein